MKLLIALTLLFSTSYLKSQNESLNGVWADSSSKSFQNCYAVFAVKQDSIFMTHYVEFNGQPFVEHGKGLIKNGKLQYTVKVTLQIPGWTTTEGQHILSLDSDGKTLRGTYSDNAGNKGPLVFKKKWPK